MSFVNIFFIDRGNDKVIGNLHNISGRVSYNTWSSNFDIFTN